MHFLITAGGTREYIDPVRFIGNASSGRMGYALAAAAAKAGHRVTLVTAPTALKPPRGAKVVNVETAGQMFEAVKRYFDRCHCLIMAAAVADYTPVRQAKTKIKKSGKSLTIKLKPTVDILKWAGEEVKSHKSKVVSKKILVGFALEDRNLRANAERKLREKNLDMIVANTPASIGVEKSTVQIKTPSACWLTITNANKNTIAGRIISFIEKQ